MKTIDVTPSWLAMLPPMLELYYIQRARGASTPNINAEFERMAALADLGASAAQQSSEVES